MSDQSTLKSEISQLCAESLRTLAELRKALTKRHTMTLDMAAGSTMLKRKVQPDAAALAKINRKAGEPSRGPTLGQIRTHNRLMAGVTVMDSSSPGHQAALAEARRIAGITPRPDPNAAINGLNTVELLSLYRETALELRTLQVGGASAEDWGSMVGIRVRSLQSRLWLLAEELHARGAEVPDLF